MSRRREREKQKTRWHGSQRDWMDIAISGCGISGLVTALALARGGHKVTIFERDSDPNFELQGFHYYWPTDPDVTYALKRLGIWDVVVGLAIHQEGDDMCVADSLLNDVLIVEGSPHPPKEERDYIGSISRGRLRHCLLYLAQSKIENYGIPIKVRWDSKVSNFEVLPSGKVEVTTSSSVFNGFAKIGMYDLLIGCDGSRSNVRKLLLEKFDRPDILTVDDHLGGSIVLRGRGCDLSRNALKTVRESQSEKKHVERDNRGEMAETKPDSANGDQVADKNRDEADGDVSIASNPAIKSRSESKTSLGDRPTSNESNTPHRQAAAEQQQPGSSNPQSQPLNLKAQLESLNAQPSSSSSKSGTSELSNSSSSGISTPGGTSGRSGNSRSSAATQVSVPNFSVWSYQHPDQKCLPPPPAGNPLPTDGIRFSILFDKFANAFFISFYENICVWIASIKVQDTKIREDILSHDADRVRRGLLAYVDKNPWHEDVVSMIRETDGEYLWAARSHFTTPENFNKFLFDRVKVKGSGKLTPPASVLKETRFIPHRELERLAREELAKQPDEVVQWLPVVLVGDAAYTSIAGGGTRAVSEGVTLAECLQLRSWHGELENIQEMNIDEIRIQSAQKGLQKFCDLQFEKLTKVDRKTWFVHKVLRHVAAPGAILLSNLLSRCGSYSLADMAIDVSNFYHNPASRPGYYLQVARFCALMSLIILGPYLAWRAYAVV